MEKQQIIDIYAEAIKQTCGFVRPEFDTQHGPLKMAIVGGACLLFDLVAYVLQQSIGSTAEEQVDSTRRRVSFLFRAAFEENKYSVSPLR